mmetsp:Transcript_15833/g.47533  ORF Transcript_15833/g.47533 Transcript_15833/m.47533 type:complete len:226 (+) Transcript_15833:134-811(+)
MLGHGGHMRANARTDVLARKVERLIQAEGLAEDQHRLDVCLAHGFVLLAGEEAELDAVSVHQLGIALRSRYHDAAIRLHEGGRKAAAGTKVEQRECGPTTDVQQKVAPVRIGLHEAKLEELTQTEFHHLETKPIALMLREMQEGTLHRHTGGQLGGEHARGAQLGKDTRHGEVGSIGEQRAEACLTGGLVVVVGLQLELGACCLQQRLDVKTSGEHRGECAQQCA